MPTSRLAAIACLVLATAAQAAGDADYDLQTPTGVLRGTLRLPEAKAPVPVALVIAGSGATDRDGNGPGLSTDAYRLLAEALAQDGVATVRYDKRGIARSLAAGPAEKDLRFGLYVEDAVAWVKRLRADGRFARVAIVGHSEGAQIGALAAGREPVDAFVSVAGIARRPSDVLRTQLEPKLPRPLYEAADKALAALERGEDPGPTPPELAALFRPSVQPYLVSWFAEVPAKAYAKLAMPVLIVQGDRDIQVAMSEAEALKAAAPKATLFVVPGMTHVLKAATEDPASQRKAYTDPSLPLVPALAPRLARVIAGGAP